MACYKQKTFIRLSEFSQVTAKLWLLISGLLISSISLACPNWQASTESEQAIGWDYQLNPQNIQVVSDPVTPNSEVIKMLITPDSTWPNGHTRVEVKHNGCSTNEGDKTFISWEFYLDKPVQTLNNIAYWETDKSYQQSMGFYLEPIHEDNEQSTRLTFFSSLPERKTQWQNMIHINTWNKISLEITWSESNKTGNVNIWFNNEAVIKNLAVQTKPDANELFIQLGLHRNQAEQVQDSIYLRHVWEASSIKELLN